MKCYIYLNSCHLIGKTKHRLGYGQASGSRVQIPGWEPGCSPRTERTGMRATPFVPQARATAGPCAVFVRIRETNHFLSRPCHFKSLPLALFRGPSFSFPKVLFFSLFFLIQMVEIPFYKTKLGPLSSLFSLTAISQHAFQRPPNDGQSYQTPNSARIKSKFPSNLTHTPPPPTPAQSLELSVPRQEHLAAALGL